MPLDASNIVWDGPSESNIAWDQPKPIGPPQQLTFAEKYVAPLLEKVMGSNPQGSQFGRFIQGASDLPIGAYQLVANQMGGSVSDPVNRRIQELEQSYQQARSMAGSKGLDVPRIAGNIGTGLLGGQPVAPTNVLPAIGQGAGIGALYGGAQPVTEGDYSTEKTKQIGMGAAGGGLGAALGSVLAKIANPSIDPSAKLLMDEGVRLTPGKIVGGAAQRVEDSSTSIPVLGDMVKNANVRSFEDFNRAGYARVLRELGKDVPEDMPIGAQGVAVLKKSLGDAYEEVLPKIEFRADQALTDKLTAAREAAQRLPPEDAAQFDKIVQYRLDPLKQSNGVLDGRGYKDLMSGLYQDAKEFKSSGDPNQRQLGQRLQDVWGAMKDTLHSSNPDLAKELSAIDNGYANYAVIREAGKAAGAQVKGFTPAQLANAVRSQDASVGKGNTATGTARMADLANAAYKILPSTVPDSGTPLRSAVGAAIAAIAGHNALPEPIAGAIGPAVAGGALATLPYTNVGQKLAQALLAKRPENAEAIAQALRNAGPFLGASASPPALNN